MSEIVSLILPAHSFSISTHSQVISFEVSIISPQALIPDSIISAPISFHSLTLTQPVTISAAGNNDSIVKANLFASGLVCLNSSNLSQPVFTNSVTPLPKSDFIKLFNHSSVALSNHSGANVFNQDTITSQVKSTQAHRTFKAVQIVLSNILPQVASIEAFNSSILLNLPSHALKKSHNNPFVSSGFHSLSNFISSTKVKPHSTISFKGSSTVSLTHFNNPQVFSKKPVSSASLVSLANTAQIQVGAIVGLSITPKSINGLLVDTSQKYPLSISFSFNPQ